MRAITKILVVLGLVCGGVASGSLPVKAQIYFGGPGFHVWISPHRHHRHYYGPPYGYPYGYNCYYGGCCPRGYTIQDGVCKPYRGY